MSLIITATVVVLAAIALVVIAITMKGKKKEVSIDNRYKSLEEKAVKKAEKMTAVEKADMLKRHSTDSWLGKVSDNVLIRITALDIEYVSVFGMHYDSAELAVNNAKDLSDEHALGVMVIEKELAILRKERFTAERHYKVLSSPFFGDVHVYNDCTIGIKAKDGEWANKAPRIAVRIEKDTETKEVGVTKVFLAAGDITTATSVHTWDLNDINEDKDFEKRIIKSADKFSAEAEVLQNLFARIEKYCYLINEGLMVFENSRWTFKPATDEQLTHIEELNKKLVKAGPKKEEPKVVNMFEHIHSSEE